MTLPLNPNQKNDIYLRVKRRLDPELVAEAKRTHRGLCLFWSLTALAVFHRLGIHAVPQAGTMVWTVLPDAKDDGTKDTAFGYEWSPDEPFSQEALAQGLLPEMHVWVGLPESQEIVDFSTGELKDVCENRHGIQWRTADPPAYVWGKPPECALYRPIYDATVLAVQKMAALLDSLKQPVTYSPQYA